MFLSEEIVVLYVIGLLFDICLRNVVLHESENMFDLPDFFKYRSEYYKNTNTISSSCVVGFMVSLSYYMYLTVMSYFPAIEEHVFAKLFLVAFMSTLVCTLCRYTDLYPDIREHYHRHIHVVTSYFADIFFAYLIATVFLIYISSFRGLVNFVKGIFFYRQEELH